MIIKFEDQSFNGTVNIQDKVIGGGVIDIYSWYLSSTSQSLILEIADDPSIHPEDLPLVGFGCAGWILEQPISLDKNTIIDMFIQAELLFKSNKLKYIPAVSCPCSDF